MHNVDFRDLVEKHELCFDVFLVEKIDILVTDLPYTVPRVQKYDNSIHDRLRTDDLVDVFKFCKAVMKSGYHGHIFYSALQVRQLFKAPAKEAEMDSD